MIGSIIHHSSWSNFWAKLKPSRHNPYGLGCYLNIRIAGVEGVVVGEDHGFGTVVAEGGFVVAADDGEGVEDVGGVVRGRGRRGESRGRRGGRAGGGAVHRSR